MAKGSEGLSVMIRHTDRISPIGLISVVLLDELCLLKMINVSRGFFLGEETRFRTVLCLLDVIVFNSLSLR